MQIEGPPSKKRARKAPYVGKQYATAGIPYQVSQPNRFWRIKKDLPAADYWKKRYWRRRITGKGSYVMDPKQSFGTRWGGRLGASLGEWAGGTAQRILGLGDYTVKRNVLSGRLPEMTNISGGGGTVIRFQEYLGDVTTSATPGEFKIDSYNLNAANEHTFPFLSQIAANYEQFDFEGLVFEFRSTSANALGSTNTALGSVMMATQYDVADPPFTSKMEMLNYEYATSVKPSADTMHLIECAPRQTTINELYTLSADVAPANTDPRLYFLGRFQIGTTGFQAASVNIGQLHCTYQIRLLKPKLATRLALTNNYALYRSATYQSATPMSGFSTGQSYDDIGLIFSDSYIQFPKDNADKYYRIEIRWSADSVLVRYPTLAYSGCTQTSLAYSGDDNVANLTCCMLIGVKCDSGFNPVRITFGAAGTLPTVGLPDGIVRVMEVSGAYNAQ